MMAFAPTLHAKRLVLPALLAVALLAGGGSTLGMAADGWLSAVGALAIPILLAAHWTGHRPLARGASWPIGLAAALGLLVIAQLLPFGEYSPFADNSARMGSQWAIGVSGVAPLGTLSLDPDATIRFGLRWLLPIAILLAALGAGSRERLHAIDLILLLALANALLAVAQLAGASWAPAPWGISGVDAGGMFANANHLGLFASIALLLSLLRLRARPAFLLLYAGILGVAAIASGSRAALLLLPAAILLAALVYGGGPRARRTIVAVAFVALVALGALFAGLSSDAGYAEPVRTALDSEGRLAFWPSLVTLAGDALPWGVGFGAFASVYRTVQPLDIVGPQYINEAHNLPLQWVIEGGVAGLAWALVALIWLVMAIRSGLSDRSSRLITLLIVSALAIVVLHSMVDYPLRTVGLASLAAMLVGLLHPPRADRDTSARRPAHAFAGALALGALGSWFTVQPFLAQAALEDERPQDALAIDPRHGEANAKLAAVALSGDEFVRARTLASKAIARSPVRADAVRVLLLADQLETGGTPNWSDAKKLGWRDSPSHILAFYATLAEDPYRAGLHAQAVLRRQQALDAMVPVLRSASSDRRFVEGLLDGGYDRTVHHPLFAIAPGADDAQLDGMLVIADLAQGDIPAVDTGQVMRALIAAGRSGDARDLYLNAHPERAMFGVGSGTERYGRVGATPFDWSFPPLAEARVRQLRDGLEISGNVATNGIAALRHLALPNGRYRIETQVEERRGNARTTVTLTCGNEPPAALQRDDEGTIAIEFTVDGQCPAPVLSVTALGSDRRFTVRLSPFRILTLG